MQNYRNKKTVLYLTYDGLLDPLGESQILPYWLGSLESMDQLTIISYGAAVHWVLEALDDLSEISADIIDLRTLQPLDVETIYKSVKKTGKAIVVQEDSMFGGIASDISALINENCFEFLDAPIKRVASIETPIPFQSDLEQQYLGKSTLIKAIQDLHNY